MPGNRGWNSWLVHAHCQRDKFTEENEEKGEMSQLVLRRLSFWLFGCWFCEKSQRLFWCKVFSWCTVLPFPHVSQNLIFPRFQKLSNCWFQFSTMHDWLLRHVCKLPFHFGFFHRGKGANIQCIIDASRHIIAQKQSCVQAGEEWVVCYSECFNYWVCLIQLVSSSWRRPCTDGWQINRIFSTMHSCGAQNTWARSTLRHSELENHLGHNATGTIINE